MERSLTGAPLARYLRRSRDVHEVRVIQGLGDPNEMDKVRLLARRPDLLITFVADLGAPDPLGWAREVARAAGRKGNMRVLHGTQEVRWS